MFDKEKYSPEEIARMVLRQAAAGGVVNAEAAEAIADNVVHELRTSGWLSESAGQ